VRRLECSSACHVDIRVISPLCLAPAVLDETQTHTDRKQTYEELNACQCLSAAMVGAFLYSSELIYQTKSAIRRKSNSLLLERGNFCFYVMCYMFHVFWYCQNIIYLLKYLM